jgi:hypothetical protein
LEIVFQGAVFVSFEGSADGRAEVWELFEDCVEECPDDSHGFGAELSVRRYLAVFFDVFFEDSAEG